MISDNNDQKIVQLDLLKLLEPSELQQLDELSDSFEFDSDFEMQDAPPLVLERQPGIVYKTFDVAYALG